MRVKKGNQEFRIPEQNLKDYLARGYDLIDDAGNVVKLGDKEQSVAGIASENKELRRRNRLLEEGVKQRDATIAELRAKLDASFKATLLPAEPPAEPPKEPDEPPATLLPADRESNPLVCPVCKKECATPAGLAKHMKSHAE